LVKYVGFTVVAIFVAQVWWRILQIPRMRRAAMLEDQQSESGSTEDLSKLRGEVLHREMRSSTIAGVVSPILAIVLFAIGGSSNYFVGTAIIFVTVGLWVSVFYFRSLIRKSADE
jgi:hypothetical protein